MLSDYSPNGMFVQPPKRTRIFYVGIGENNSTTSARAKKLVEEFKRETNPDSTHYENIFLASPNNHHHVHIF
jgi:hypothetical protein